MSDANCENHAWRSWGEFEGGVEAGMFKGSEIFKQGGFGGETIDFDYCGWWDNAWDLTACTYPDFRTWDSSPSQ